MCLGLVTSFPKSFAILGYIFYAIPPFLCVRWLFLYFAILFVWWRSCSLVLFKVSQALLPTHTIQRAWPGYILGLGYDSKSCHTRCVFFFLECICCFFHSIVQAYFKCKCLVQQYEMQKQVPACATNFVLHRVWCFILLNSTRIDPCLYHSCSVIKIDKYLLLHFCYQGHFVINRPTIGILWASLV